MIGNRIPQFFKPLWWEYYARAVTIYQVHSPFLFALLKKIVPVIFNRGSGNYYSDNTTIESQQQKILMLGHLLQVENLVWKNGGVAPTPKTKGLPNGSRPGQTSQILTNHRVSDDNCAKQIPYFQRMEVWSHSIPGDLDVLETPMLIVIMDIHRTRNHHMKWQILSRNMGVDFTLEFYNLGILICYPVLDRPKHITFIPWQMKPWKALII